MEICGPIGTGQGCSLCERCKAETLLAEADFRERHLREENQRLDQWLGVIDNYPIDIMPKNMAAEQMKDIASIALREVAAGKLVNPVRPFEERSDDPVQQSKTSA